MSNHPLDATELSSIGIMFEALSRRGDVDVTEMQSVCVSITPPAYTSYAKNVSRYLNTIAVLSARLSLFFCELETLFSVSIVHY